MNDEKGYLLKLLSILLQYPDDEFILSLEELKEAVAQVPQTEQRERCVTFLGYLGSNSLIRLQEEYTSTFDLNPSTCLNLTYHKWGDSKERGNALVDFHRLYHQAGYESSTGELPDYLPLVLEYLSLKRNGDHSSNVDRIVPALAGLIRQKQGTSATSLVGQYCEEVEAISSRLQEAGSVYAGLLAIVTDLFIEMKSMGV
ncbi:MAG: nitrate reductase molybdenum cofactor assembly chaperone [Deltaproteobacteria bacterium]|nr:nitrate reductase molybdenum cofactor assembly chaperone [Deltaproteobacteria bacterium]